MRIESHRKFDKHYAKLTIKLQRKVDKAIDKFKIDPFDPPLRNHALSGPMQGKRAFQVTGDIRVIFEEHDGYVLVIMLDVGRHNQVY